MKRLILLVTILTSAMAANAQLPNEKFGKPSKLEWEFNGWGDATSADALVLCKTMTVSYQLFDQVSSTNESSSEIGYDNLADFGKNMIDGGNILVKYEFRLRIKILKPEGASHANFDITYFNADNEKEFLSDELTDLKVRVFNLNEKGKVEKKNIDTRSFVSERLDDNYMVLHVVVPDAQAGSIIEYQYNITSTRPAFLYDWTFQECIPTVRSKCDMNIPSFLQFKMNVPIHKLIKPSVEEGRVAYDTNRPDLKKGKTCVTNHYTIVGDYILPPPEEIAPFTSFITNTTAPAPLPKGVTHLKIK